MNRETLDYMRDCVRQAYLEGVSRGQEFHKMRHALIVELKHIGCSAGEIKDVLTEWNQRCEKCLSLSEIKRHLYAYVDWVFSLKETRLSCKALQNYCTGEKNCQYRLRTDSRNRAVTVDMPFDMRQLEVFLDKRFKANGYIMNMIVKALRSYQQEKATGEVILIGYRTIVAIIRDKWRHQLDAMCIHRRMQLLIEEGVIEQVVQGKSGMFRQKANGYRFLPWKLPTNTHINPMCNN